MDEKKWIKENKNKRATCNKNKISTQIKMEERKKIWTKDGCHLGEAHKNRWQVMTFNLYEKKGRIYVLFTKIKVNMKH